jgi:hypothetical protein
MARTVLPGALLAGIALFVWQSISHMAMGLGDAGMREIPNEPAVLAAMRQFMPEPGLYFFPGMGGPRARQEPAAVKEWERKYMAGPSGLLVFHPRNETPAMSPARLLRQFSFGILAGLVAAFLLSRALGSLRSLPARVGFVALLGVLPTCMVGLPYWNWYGFPARYMLASLADQVIGFAVMGLVLAAIVRSPAIESA